MTGVSVKFLMVGETNSMVGYHLMTKGHSIQLGFGSHCQSPPPPAGPGQHPDNKNHININILGVSYKITIKSQPEVSYKVVPF